MKKGSHHTPETKEKIRKFMIGTAHHCIPRSEISKKEQSETMEKRFPPGPNHFNYGKRHSKETKEKMRKARIGKYNGENNVNWKGGRFRHTLGYVCVMSFYHPYKNKRGYILEHRLVIEEQIKRFLKPEEACHHINKIKDDNRPENLMAFKTQAAHNSFETGHKINPSDIIFDGRNIHVKAS